MNATSDPRPIVVGYDASETALVALSWAGRLAGSLGASVTVLHAAETLVYAQDSSFGYKSPEEEREFAERVAEEGAQRLRSRQPELTVTTMGSRYHATVALDEASTTASFIVVGSHGRGRIGAVMLGSTAYAVGGHARCPVIVVRAEDSVLPGPDHPVVVGADGSDGSERALEAAAVLAERWKARLVVVTSWTPPPPDPWNRPPLGYPSTAACLEDFLSQATALNRDVVSRVRSAHEGLSVEEYVVEARPEDAVMTASADTAMVVLGSRGHGKLAGILLGSTARSVLHQTTKPVMIVH
ncbi:MAG: universal stress protein [Ornithinimicrobium sp.]